MNENKKAGIENIIAMNALYRPGPKKFIPQFIENYKHPEKIKYICPQLKPILEPTYGIIVYQEQVMQIVRDLAGYTWGRSDLIRRAMSKKHQEELDAERPIFVYGNENTRKEGETLVPGCVKNGISEAAANEIWDSMIDFAKYAFNKSHAAAYSVTSFWTAYLKYYYTSYFIASVINYTDKIEEIADDVADAKDFGVNVLPPNVNKSEVLCRADKNNIYFGLSKILNIGESVSKKIVNERNVNGEYTDITDFIYRTGVGSGVYTSLVKAGAFDCMGYTRKQISYNSFAIKDIFNIIDKIKEKEKFINNAKKIMEFVEEYDNVDELKIRIKEESLTFNIASKKAPTQISMQRRIETAKETINTYFKDLKDIDIKEFNVDDDILENLQSEKEVLGIYLSGHPIDEYNVLSDPINTITEDVTTEKTAISGFIKDFKVFNTKNGKKMAAFNLEDKTGTVNAICFPDSYLKNMDLLKNDTPVCCYGRLQEDEYNSTEENTAYQLVVSEVVFLHKNQKAYRIVCKISELNQKIEDIKAYLTDDYGDELYWLDKTTGLMSKVNKNLVQETVMQHKLEKL